MGSDLSRWRIFLGDEGTGQNRWMNRVFNVGFAFVCLSPHFLANVINIIFHFEWVKTKLVKGDPFFWPEVMVVVAPARQTLLQDLIFSLPVSDLMETAFNQLAIAGDNEVAFDFLDDMHVLDEAVEKFRLIGRFLTEKPINFIVMKNRMIVVWHLGRSMKVTQIEPNLFSFQFYHEVDWEKVLLGGPWSFDNYMLVLNNWKPGVPADSFPLDEVPMWIQIHDLPRGAMSEVIGKQIGDYIGKFMEYDLNNNFEFSRRYMRIRVMIDVKLPLKRCKKIKKTQTEFSYINFKYERLCNFCYIYGLMGHTDRSCEMLFHVKKEDVQREWGEWLKATFRRSAEQFGAKWLKDSGSSSKGGGFVIEAAKRGIPKLTPSMMANLTNRAIKGTGPTTDVVIPRPRLDESGKGGDDDVVMGDLDEVGMDLRDDRKRSRAGNGDGSNVNEKIETVDTSSSNKQDTVSSSTTSLARPDVQARQAK